MLRRNLTRHGINVIVLTIPIAALLLLEYEPWVRPPYRKLAGQSIETDKPIIAVLDSGIDRDVPFLRDYEVYFINLTDEIDDDLRGHGTAVTVRSFITPEGIIIPPDIFALLHVKVMDEHGRADELAILRGLEVAGEQGAVAINLSLAMWMQRDPGIRWCKRAHEVITSFGIRFVAAAAGNDGIDLDDVYDPVLVPQLCNRLLKENYGIEEMVFCVIGTPEKYSNYGSDLCAVFEPPSLQ